MSRVNHYLLTVYELAETAGEPVSTGRIADSIGRSPAATTEMVQRLEARGLVDHEPYAGVRLTTAGRDRASELSDSYETICRFFDEVLEIDDHRREAAAVVGTVSPAVVTRLETTLLAPSSSSRADESTQ
ncbi:metal-dependent transcriptional regulator [Natronorubrum thiooxidans]|uniref:Iron (Metal) dependent repressor, DtxR family n=1 Tax=Natronorubrum thiooxidans TaxID=308853 RepID=A0A1N7G7P6_9EURY|nr:metal-dependent transcriptional regulator [Natronorubrum thiooxidans]SIS08627.1 iron (metal) dependent repressor, DtxR family [Natronorubrum thiooxidans]